MEVTDWAESFFGTPHIRAFKHWFRGAHVLLYSSPRSWVLVRHCGGWSWGLGTSKTREGSPAGLDGGLENTDLCGPVVRGRNTAYRTHMRTST